MVCFIAPFYYVLLSTIYTMVGDKKVSMFNKNALEPILHKKLDPKIPLYGEMDRFWIKLEIL